MWVECEDAGDLPGVSQPTAGSAELARIAGSLTDPFDADTYWIRIVDPGAFSAFAHGDASLDPQLFLFDPNGIGIAANDDVVGGMDPNFFVGDPNSFGEDPNSLLFDPNAFFSELPVGDPLYSNLDPGLYLLAISSFDLDPHRSGLEIFPDGNNADGGDWSGVHPPAGPGGPGPLESWQGEPFGLNDIPYSIDLTGAGFALSGDEDCDGIAPPIDNCPHVSNADQIDTDTNGIGDACQCGDVTGDGFTNVSDALRIARGEVLSDDPYFDRCDVSGDTLCNVSDALAIARGKVGSAPEDQRCPAYRGFSGPP